MSTQTEIHGAPAHSGRTGLRRLARLITEIFAPAPSIVGLSLVVAWEAAPNVAEALKWGLLASLFASVIPFAFILVGVRRRRLSDHHIGVREQRPIPLLVAMASVLFGLGLLASWGAPSEIVALVAVMLGGLVTSTLVTLLWKLSIHTALMGAALVVLVLVFGSGLPALTPVVALVAWARVALGDHGVGQVPAGAAVGATVPGVVCPLWH